MLLRRDVSVLLSKRQKEQLEQDIHHPEINRQSFLFLWSCEPGPDLPENTISFLEFQCESFTRISERKLVFVAAIKLDPNNILQPRETTLERSNRNSDLPSSKV